MLVESLASLQKDFLETSRSNRKYKSTCIHKHLRTTSKIIIIHWRAYYSAVSHGLSVFINKTKIVQKYWWRSVNFTLILTAALSTTWIMSWTSKQNLCGSNSSWLSCVLKGTCIMKMTEAPNQTEHGILQ